MGDTDTEFNTAGLDKLLKAMKGPIPEAKVGILGGGARSGGDTTNAEIGKKHEFGDEGMPIRSFLRVPISENMQKYLDKAGAFDESVAKEIIKKGSFLEFVRKIGIIGEAIVADAFATSGFGRWKSSDMRYKKNKQTLVESTQLRNSISSEVSE